MSKTLIYILLILLMAAGEINAQWNYGQPFSTSPQQSTWQTAVGHVPVTGNQVMDSLTAPYPTNAWFNLFFLYGNSYPYTLGQGTLGQNSSFVNPYQVGFGYNYVGYSNPRSLLSVNYKPFFISETGGSFPHVEWDGGVYMFFGTTDPTNFVPVILNDYTDLSATVKFFNTANSNNYYYAPLVRGMPYVSMFYNNVTPAVYFPTPVVWKINGVIGAPDQEFSGTSFKVQSVEGDTGPFRSQTWMIYSSQTITLKLSRNGQTEGLIGTSPFTGYLRAAHLTYFNDPKASIQQHVKIFLMHTQNLYPLKEW